MIERTLLITGASGGIGAAVVARSASLSTSVLAVARDQARLDALRAEYPHIQVVAADVTDPDGIERITARLAEMPPLGGFAHLVGSLSLKPIHRLSLAEWRAQLSIHLDSAFLVLQCAVQQLLVHGGPLCGVFCSSIAATVGLPNHESVSAAKAGIEGLMRAAATTYADKGLRLNAVAPSLTETQLTCGFVSSAATRTAMDQQHPLGRIGQPDDQAAAIAWLLSHESSWVTGQVLGVDGGLRHLRVRR